MHKWVFIYLFAVGLVHLYFQHSNTHTDDNVSETVVTMPRVRIIIIFIYLFAVTPIWVKAKYIHSYKISERKQADKRITTCTLVLLKFRLELWPMLTYFHNSNDCFIKSQTVGKSSNWGFRLYWICILGWSDLKLGVTLWKS